MKKKHEKEARGLESKKHEISLAAGGHISHHYKIKN